MPMKGAAGTFDKSKKAVCPAFVLFSTIILLYLHRGTFPARYITTKEDKTMHNPKQSFAYHHVRLAPAEQIGLHRQPSWELTLIVTGSGIRLIGDTSEPFRRGEVVLMPPETPHCWYFAPNDTDPEGKIENITLSFPAALPDRCAAAFPELAPAAESLKNIREAVRYNEPEAGRIAALLQAMRTQDAVERLSSLLRMLPLLARTDEARTVGSIRATDKTQERLNMVRVYVACNAARGITLDDMARHVSMSRSAFCAFFRQAAGKTFFTYLNEYRTELACRLLAQGDLPVSDICYRAGFADVPYFNRVFRRYKGCTPSAYRLGSHDRHADGE